jgi:hypothetical protein
MADTLLRPQRIAPSAARKGVPAGGSAQGGNVGLQITGSAVMEGFGAALLGLIVVEIVVLVLWATDSRSTAAGDSAWRFAAALWLLAQRGGFSTTTGAIGLMPIGLTVIPAYMLWRAGHRVARYASWPATRRQQWRTLFGITIGISAAYAATAAVVAYLAADSGLHPHVGQAAVGAGVLAAVMSSFGVWRATRLPVRVSRPVRVVARATGAAMAVLLGGGAALWGVLLTVHAGSATTLTRALHPGSTGGVGLTLASIALIPNAVIWAASVLVGPGFVIGTGGGIGLFGVSVGAVPALPVLASLPHQGTPPGWAALLLAVPVFAGVLAGLMVVRGLAPAGRLRAAGYGVLVGVGSGGVMLLLAALSGGPAGPARLQTVGPGPWQTAGATALAIGVPAMLTAWLRTSWLRTEAAGGRHFGHLLPAGRQPRSPSRLHRPGWWHRPSWLHRPTWWHRPGWLRLPHPPQPHLPKFGRRRGR